MTDNVIFCFSGSGNCLDIAKTMAKELGDTDIIMMRKTPAVTDVTGAKTVGFVFPNYGGGMPSGLEKKIASIKMDKSSYKYGIISYCGYKGNGLATLNKHVKLNYWNALSHHCSCIWLFPHKVMLPMLSVEDAEQRSERLAKAYASDVKNRITFDGKIKKNALNTVESAAFPKIAIKKAKSYVVDTTKCVGCGLCANVCPKGNIIMSNKVPTFGTNCIGCLSCVQYCPHGAIDVGSITKSRERYHNPKITANDLMQEVIHVE